ncbi:MAG: AAA family ATPase [Actinomycetota bacterium]|nr:AAA family ATPase [Actinomycetota bacterium]
MAARIVADGQLLPRGPIPLVALGAWMYRKQSVETVQELVDLVVNELKLDRDGLIGKVYSTDTATVDTTSAFEDAPISGEALLEFLKAPVAPPPAPPLGTIADVVGRIEGAMERAGVALAPGLVGRVVRAWLNRDIAMLVGAPGTGKSTFAREFGNACELEIPDQRETKVVLVDPDFDAARLLGYLDLAGKFRPSEFTKEVLQTGQPLVPRVVIFEEGNTAQLEAYAGQLLHAVESAGAVQLPDDSEPRLPFDVLLLATGNSVRDEPETRLPVSRPSKRRMTIIEMPNILYDAWKQGQRPALMEQADLYLEYERTRLDQRSEDPPLLDKLRAPRLQAVQTLKQLDEDIRNLLLDLVEYLFETDDGQNLMTIGLLIDILRDVIYADEESAAEALGWQVTGKLLEQVTRIDVARGLAERCAALPNAEAINRAVARMDLKDGSVSPLL